MNWENKNIVSYIGNLEDKSSLRQVPKQDIVIHMAGVTHSKYSKKYVVGNVKTTENLISHFKNLNTKHFIFISSRSANEYSGSYGLSKLMAEQIIIKSKIPFSILSIAENYGKDMKGLSILKKVIKFPFFTFYPYSNSIKLCPVHISDVCFILKQIMLSKARDKTYLVAGPKEYSIRELCEIISKNYGTNNTFIPIPIFLIRIVAYFNLIFKKPFIYPDQISRLISQKSHDIQLLKDDFNFNPKLVEDLLEKV